jgi:acyl-CoA thioester hydrolase
LTKQSEFRTTRRVQFHETDAAGIVHFSWYPRYMEEAEHAFWRSVGLSVAGDSPYGWPRISMSCDYLHPLHFEDEFDIHLRIIAMSDRTIQYACVFSLGDRNVAKLRMTTVCVTREGPNGSFRATSMPAVVRERFEVAADAAE